jgi:glycosyltransferase involved in cell wall biosynthesis
VLVAMHRAVVRHELLQVPLRLFARRALERGAVIPGAVTVVIVNWNSERFLTTSLRAIDRYTGGDVRVIVVDNHSQDGSWAVAKAHTRVRWIPLPRNLGHELGMDLGFLLARTQYVIALDVDAFPIADGWVERLLAPLRQGYSVSGAHVRGGFVHPCCLAMRLEDFVSRRHSFMARRAGRWATDVSDRDAPGWDTGWKISLREERLFLFERTEVGGPGDIGSSWDGLIYHNFYSTRFGSKLAPPAEEVAAGVSPDSASVAWDQAVLRYLPED